jgi:NAD(P)-dependent dehydrogenase (short-subunit alcohol dehydrogenase family)
LTVERALITGASRGVGKAVALRLAQEGRELILSGRDRDALEEVAGAVRDRGGTATVAVADLATPAGIGELATLVGDAPLGALVHNAGVAVVKPVEEVSPEEWQLSLALLVTAPFLLTRALLTNLSPGSSIVHILSIAARRGFSGWSAYCAGKSALRGLSASLREELRGRGIRVIDVVPAATATELWDGIPGSWPRERMLPPEEVAEAVAYAISRPPGVLVETVEVGDLSGPI